MVHPIRWHCQKVLPLVYDDSLSYYEQVCKLIGKVNEAIDELNDLQEKYTEILSYYENIDSVIDGKIDAKMVEVNAMLRRELQALDNKLTAQMDDIVIRMNGVLAEVDRLTNLVNTFYENSKDYTDSAVTSASARLEREIARFEGRVNVELEEIRKEIADGMRLVQVYNPTTGGYSDIETAIADVYDSARVDEGLTVAEYSGHGLSVNEYASFNMSVKTYAMIGKKVIERFYKWFYNPFTGLKNTVDMIASWCATEMFGTYSVSEYEALDLDVDGYEALDYTCRDYLEANHGNRQVLTLDGNGLTNDQYSSIGVANL